MNEGIPFIIPSDDKRASIMTVISIMKTIESLNYYAVPIIVSGHSNIPVIRSQGFKILKQYDDRLLHINNKVKGFMIDSDVITNFQYFRLIPYVEKAINDDLNFSIPYRLPNGYYDIFDMNLKPMVASDLENLNDWDRIGASGLGFYFGDLYLDYKFHYDEKFGEDINYFIDNHIDLRIVKLPLSHMKYIELY